jgi:hypothetical protein
MWQYWSHAKYTLRHKYYVMIECIKEGIILRGITHDLSKFTPSEFSGYANYFFNEDGSRKENSDENTDDIKKLFDEAFRHHQMSNDHHWQYWIIRRSPHSIIHPMTKDAYIEMICDWKGAARANYQNELDIPLPWYRKNHSRLVLHSNTRELVEEKIGFKKDP